MKIPSRSAVSSFSEFLKSCWNSHTLIFQSSLGYACISNPTRLRLAEQNSDPFRLVLCWRWLVLPRLGALPLSNGSALAAEHVATRAGSHSPHIQSLVPTLANNGEKVVPIVPAILLGSTSRPILSRKNQHRSPIDYDVPAGGRRRREGLPDVGTIRQQCSRSR